MSRPNNGPNRSNEFLLQKKRKWLRDKVEEIKTSWADTVCALRDSIVAEPVNAANALLNRPDNGLTLQEIATAGMHLEDCNRCLFDLVISNCRTRVCNGRNSHGDLVQIQRVGLIDDLPAILPNSEAMHIVSVPQVDENCMQLEEASMVVQRSGLRYNSENESGPFEPIAAIDDNNNEENASIKALNEVIPAVADLNLTLTSIPPNDDEHSTPKRGIEASKTHSLDTTIKAQTCADLSSEVSTLEGTSSKNIYSCSSEDGDTNVFRGTVSDVVSPHHFSVQPEKNLPRIKKLQRELNRFYEHHTEKLQLRFTTAPRLGEYCAVIFPPDNNWYRACVIEASSESTIVVEYIDYGNMDEVSWSDALKLHPSFSQLPKQSICCSLAGVKPVSDGDNCKGRCEWSNHTIEWFDKFVYGRSYEVVEIKNQSSAIKTGVDLFYIEHSKDKIPELKSVVSTLVELKLAACNREEVLKLDEKDLVQMKGDNNKQSACGIVANCCSSISNEEKAEENPKKLDCHSFNRSGNANESENKMKNSLNRKPSSGLTCIPAGMERSHNRSLNQPKHANPSHKCSGYSERRPFATPRFTPCNNQMSHKNSEEKIDMHPADRDVSPYPENEFLTPTSSISPVQANDAKACDDDKKMSEWNPMMEDYNSVRNSYAVDDENACVATEGFDPERIQVCPHYIRGKCWNGDKCHLSHPSRSPSGELRNEIPTFSASSLNSLDMRPGAWSIVRLTVFNSIDNFYVHVVKLVENMKECIRLAHDNSGLPIVSQELDTLMTDMKQFYSQGTRRLKDLIKPCTGEMYAIHVPEENCFYRGMVLNVSYSKASFTTANVHLVDFGRNVIVLERYLHPMCAVFMHLPKQAVHCSLYGNDFADFSKIKKNIFSAGRPHLAMKVNNKCEETDGPLNITLYLLNKDGLHHILS